MFKFKKGVLENETYKKSMAKLKSKLGWGLKTGSEAFLRFRPTVEHLEDRTVLNAGGGFTGSGILGQYYANITNPTDWLQNPGNYSPSFSRTDARIDFTNNSNSFNASPGGVPQDVNYAAVGSTNFAVMWTGSFIPKYTEKYLFETKVQGGVVLKINGTTVINDTTPYSISTDIYFRQLTAGTTYTIEMDYFNQGNSWNAQLHWLSKDANPNDIGYYFPEEAIEPATSLGLNYVVDPKQFADVVKFASYSNATTTNPVDGWPTQDFQLTLFYNGGEYAQYDAGTYLLQFTGEASVAEVYGPPLDFKVGSTDYGQTLPFGAGFNGTTTTATVTFTDVAPWGQMHLGFTNTQRNGGGGGVTNIHLMRPTTLGGTTDYPVGTLLTTAGLAEAAPFTAVRMMGWTNAQGNFEVNWADRALPSVNFWTQTSDGSMPWETAVAVANATGKDVYINIPVDATDTYITNLVNLFKYGSDGVNPYTSTQANPVWAPLNPNLNIIVEYANEVWNWNIGVYGQVNNQVLQNKLNNTAKWQQFSQAGGWVNTNSSGAATSSDTSLWTVVMDADISNIFRTVYGNAAMPANASGVINPDPRIRPVFEWQYGGSYNGGTDPSNTAMSNFSKQLPQSINYYIWGGGGGCYSDAKTGGFSDVQFANPNFDSGTASWTFSSGAGIVANGSSLGNPNSPTQVAPSSAAKTTTNAVVLAPGASISQSVNFSGGYADLTLYATQTAANNYSNGLQVTIDGQVIGESEGAGSWSGSQNAWAWDRSAAFNTSAGWHTITFTNTWSTSSKVNVFLDNFGIQTVNGLFNEVAASGQPSISSVQNDVAICQQFGLHDVGYEGGFEFDQNLGYGDISGYSSMGAKGYSSLTPNVGMYANLDPRAEQFAINTLTQFYQYGGALPFLHQSSGNVNSWGVMVPNLYSAVNATTTIPKVEAVVTLENSLPPTPPPSVTPAPGYFTTPANDWQSVGSQIQVNFQVNVPAVYSVGVTIKNTNNGSTGTFQIYVDNTLIGSVNVNDSSTTAFTLPVRLSSGLHNVNVVCTAVNSTSLGLASLVVYYSPNLTVGQPIFFDNFEGGSLSSSWNTTAGGGTWAVSNGTLNQTNSGAQGTSKAIINQAVDPTTTEIVARVKVTSMTGAGRIGVGLYTNSKSGNGYNLVFFQNMSSVIFYYNGVGQSPTYTFSGGQLNSWYWFRFQVTNNTLYGKIWADGTAEPTSWIYTYTPGSNWNLTGGSAALNSGAGATGSFDHVSVISVPYVPVPVCNPLYWDNFNGSTLSSAWTTTNGTWQVSGNSLQQTNSSNSDPVEAMLTDQTYAPNTTQILAQVEVNAISGNGTVGVGLYTNKSTGLGYNLVFHGNTNTVQFMDDGVGWGPSYSFSGGQVNTWYWFDFQVSNGSLYGKIWLAGSAMPTSWMYTYTPGSTWNLTGGAPGLNSGGGATASFADVIVVDPVAPGVPVQPSASKGVNNPAPLPFTINTNSLTGISTSTVANNQTLVELFSPYSLVGQLNYYLTSENMENPQSPFSPISGISIPSLFSKTVILANGNMEDGGNSYSINRTVSHGNEGREPSDKDEVSDAFFSDKNYFRI